MAQSDIFDFKSDIETYGFSDILFAINCRRQYHFFGNISLYSEVFQNNITRLADITRKANKTAPLVLWRIKI